MKLLLSFMSAALLCGSVFATNTDPMDQGDDGGPLTPESGDSAIYIPELNIYLPSQAEFNADTCTVSLPSVVPDLVLADCNNAVLHKPGCSCVRK